MTLHVNRPLYRHNVSVFVPFKNRVNEDLCCCLHLTSKRSKVPLTKTVYLTVRAKEPLKSVFTSPFSSSCFYDIWCIYVYVW